MRTKRDFVPRSDLVLFVTSATTAHLLIRRMFLGRFAVVEKSRGDQQLNIYNRSEVNSRVVRENAAPLLGPSSYQPS